MHYSDQSLFSLSLICLFFFLCPRGYAQDAPDSSRATIRIHIVTESDGRPRIEEKVYTVDNLTEEAQKLHIDKLLDSLEKEGKKNRRITITFEEGSFRSSKGFVRDSRNDIFRPDGFPGWADALAFKGQQLAFKADSMVQWLDSGFALRSKELDRDLSGMFADQQKRMIRLERDIAGKVKDIEVQKHIRQPFTAFPEADAKTVRNALVYATQPYDGTVHVRFRAPEKGDVTILATDTRGKEAGRKEVKDFEGEFVGQLTLKKGVSGTIFVSIVQKEDGVVRRIVLPGEKADAAPRQ